MNIRNHLNTEQKEAVRHGEGPLLIIAGAGTGKTTVITERIKWLIFRKKALPAEILALTFTQKAALEMEGRVDEAMPYGITQMYITTFHAFGEKILREEGLNIGLDPGFKLMTEAETVIFFRRNLFKFDLEYFRPLGNPTKFVEGMLNHFSRLKDEDITPIQYFEWAKNQKSKIKNQKLNEEELININKYLELAQAYRTYEELKIKEGVMDFADLIGNTLKLFRQRKNILKEYQEKYKYILIDEFQDTNFAQNEMAVLLAEGRNNITVVGDDDQAIYRWRGAAISNIIQFRQRFKKAKLVVLTKNYRSTKAILDTSYRLIQFNNPDRLEVKEKIKKKLKSAKKIKGEPVEFIYTRRVENEAEEVVKRIQNSEFRIQNELGEKKYSWKDFAILVRANDHAEPFVRALMRAGIPYQFLGPGMLFKQPEVKDLIAYLKLLDNLNDSVAAYRILTMPVFGINARDLRILVGFAKRIGLSVYETMEVITYYKSGRTDHWTHDKNYDQYLPNISTGTKDHLTKIVKMIEKHLKLAKSETAGQILYLFLESSGLLKTMVRYDSTKEEKVALNISKFFDRIKSYETTHEDAGISAVLEFIDMSMELGESPTAAETDWTENDAVNILTIHSSKGLEFTVVFLVNLVAQRFPTSLRKERIPIPDALVKEILSEGDYHLEEERRLFYVGATRAKDRLYLTAANYYGEGKRERKISPFVVESLGNKSVIVTMKQLNNETMKPFDKSQGKQLTLLEWKKKEDIKPTIVRRPIEYLSFSQIETFNTCPLQYKYRYILKIPVPPTAAGSFGTSIHLALQKFYETVKQKNRPDKGYLLRLLDQVWIPIGYGNKNYEKKMQTRGKEMLSYFFDNFYDPNIIPRDLEQIFKIKLNPELKIGGKIDRVDMLKDGKLEIIDYKTGKRPTDKEIEKNLQMTVYALAATGEGIYNKKPDEVILTFYFFDAKEKVSSTRSKGQLKEARKRLIETAETIGKSNFEPKVGPWCDFCDFRLICEAW